MKYSSHFLIMTAMMFAHTCFCQEELFLQAHKLYKEHNYREALTRYQMIKNKGSAVWYNMGNCSFNLHNDVDALVYWMRARKGASVDQRSAIDHNINLLAEKMKHPELAVSTTVYRSMTNRIAALSWLVLQLLFLSIWYLGWLVLRSKRSRAGSIMIGCLLMINATLFIIKNNDQQKIGLVKSTTALLYTGPHEQYQRVGSLMALTKVNVEQKDGNWYKVRHLKNNGWIKDESLALV